MTSRFTRLDNGNLEIRLTFPWPEIQSAFNQVKADAVKKARVPGFRPGKAPASLVEDKLESGQLYSRALQTLLPPAYSRAVKDHGLKPLVDPQITLSSAKPGSDWEITALTCEAPSVSVDTSRIKLSPSDRLLPEPEKFSRILDIARSSANFKVPDLLVEEEANHRLSHLAENLTRLGLTLDQYLSTKKLSAADLKAQTAASARADLEAEFILESVRRDRSLPDRKSALDFLISQV